MVKLIWFVNFRNNIYTFNFSFKNLVFNFQGNLNSSSNFIPYKYILNSQSESSAHASRISIHNKGKKITQWKNPINEIMDMKGITFQALHWIASNLFFPVELHCTFKKTWNIEVGEEESFPWQSFIFCLPWVAGPTKIMGHFKANLFKPSKWKMRGKHRKNSECCLGHSLTDLSFPFTVHLIIKSL